MAVMGAAQGIGGIGAAVGAVGGAIAGFFGAENPLDKMLKFQAYTFDTEKIKTNAAAVKAYAEAIKDFPTGTSGECIHSGQRCYNWITRRRDRSFRSYEKVWYISIK